MKTRVEEREKDIIIFMDAETVEEAARILRITGQMVGKNSGYCSFRNDVISGWITVPLSKEHNETIES